MIEDHNTRLAKEVARLDAEIKALEKQLEVSETEINRVIGRIVHLIDEEIDTVEKD